MHRLRFFLLVPWLPLLLLLLSGGGSARAQSPIVVGPDTASVELWPAVGMRSDADQALTLQQVIADPGSFAPPRSAYATLGFRKDVIWLRVPIVVEPAGGQAGDDWIVDIDYSLLNRIDVAVVAQGRVLQRAVLGNVQPFAQRPLQSRSHAAAFSLPPGRYELYFRVDSVGARILPITLNRFSAFHTRALNEQMLQGLLTSLGLGLLLYSLLQWLSLREHLYLKYAALVLCSVLFSVHFFGIGELYLWTDNIWLERHLAGITSLLAAAATALFVEDALGGDVGPWLRRAFHAVAAILAVFALAHALDLIDIRQVGMLMGSLGLMPALMGLPGAIARLRRGDSVGAYFIAAWVGYFVASAIMVGVVKGQIGVNFWTMHSFQFGATLDMLMFMRIAVLRSAVVHVAAQRAASERDALHSLAHSDPLTGLLNRRGLNDALTVTLAGASADRMLAVFVLDLDQFKPVNDQFGHDVGDELLMVVAHRLRATVRAGDAVARFGGDEFVVMAGGLQTEAQARDLGQKLLNAFDQPFALSQQTSRIGATIGYALAPKDAADGPGLLKAADAAMYAGKQAGKRCLRRVDAVLVTA